MIFYNCIRLELIKDRSIRINDKDELGRVRVFYKEYSGRFYKEIEIYEWEYRRWLKLEPTEEKLTLRVCDIDHLTLSKQPIVQIFSTDKILKAEIPLLAIKKSLKDDTLKGH